MSTVKKLWEEVREVIEEVDVRLVEPRSRKRGRCREKRCTRPCDLNQAFKVGLQERGWSERRSAFWATADQKLLRSVYGLPENEQKRAIEDTGHEAIMSYNQTDFVKDRVAVEVQFGKCAFVAHDLFVKHLSFYVSDIIDTGIEILPMKELEREMSSGVPYYERDLLNVLRQGRGVPAVPLVLIGVAP